MVGIVVAQRFLMTPDIVGIGRSIDFVPADARGSAGKKFEVLHTAYVGAELAKWLLGLGLATILIAGRRKGSREDVREQLDLINKANYRHIDR
jgi:hypothetical protein